MINKFFPLFTLFYGLSLVGCSCTGNVPQLKINRSETFFNNLGGEPENLHPIRSTDLYSAIIQYYTLESLLNKDSYTYGWQASLAKKWHISPDNLTFTFELYDNLKWSDGKPLTVQDVKFSLEAYKNPEYGGIRTLPYYEQIESVKILSKNKIQFKASKIYFGNFQVIANMAIIPEHIYKDPKKKLSKTIVGSGPYLIDTYIKGKILVLKKNPHWKRDYNPFNKGRWQFPNIVFRFIKTTTDELLRMEKEHIDFSDLSAEAFVKKTNRPPWGTKIRKVKYKNKQASGYGYIGFNLKKQLFQDRKVRKALAHLMNRQLMNEKFNYGKYELARGPWYFWSDYANPTVQTIEFSPSKAIQLLQSAGWADRDQNGILEKTIKGKKKELEFTLLFANPDSEKYITIYQQDLKKAGIKLNLKILDWTSFLRLLEDRKFEAIMLGWGGGSIDFDPKQIWHSQSSRKGGSNYISYSNKEVDALIDKARIQIDRKKRMIFLRQVYKKIAEDVPYIFMFNKYEKFYGVNKRIKIPAPTLPYDRGMVYWSLKPTL